MLIPISKISDAGRRNRNKILINSCKITLRIVVFRVLEVTMLVFGSDFHGFKSSRE